MRRTSLMPACDGRRGSMWSNARCEGCAGSIKVKRRERDEKADSGAEQGAGKAGRAAKPGGRGVLLGQLQGVGVKEYMEYMVKERSQGGEVGEQTEVSDEARRQGGDERYTEGATATGRGGVAGVYETRQGGVASLGRLRTVRRLQRESQGVTDRHAKILRSGRVAQASRVIVGGRVERLRAVQAIVQVCMRNIVCKARNAIHVKNRGNFLRPALPSRVLSLAD